MSFDARKRKSWSSKSGVSEIIGNILILMITVILFSSIMVFVQNIPMPQQLTKATFSAGITFSSNGTKANLTVTHAGGDSMKATQTLILVNQDSMSLGFNLAKDHGLNNALVWKTGMTWAKQLNATKYSSVITVTVVDLVKHTSVWSSQVTGGMGQNPPVISQRWVDSNPATPSPDPVRDGNNFAFYATITDADGDLATNQIWIDASQIPGSSSHWAPTSQNGAVFMWNFSYIISNHITAAQLDGKVILIHAQDSKVPPHITESTFIMTVTKLPYDTIDKTVTNFIEGGGLDPSGLLLYFPNQAPALGVAYGTFEENHTRPGTANLSKAKTLFTKDELVFIRVASKYMTNVLGSDSLGVSDTRTNTFFPPAYTGSSTATTPFYIVSSGSSTVFECQFNTSSLPPGTYDLNITLASSPGLDGTSKVFKSELAIIVKGQNSTISFMPQMYLFKDVARTVPWGAKLTPYNISEGVFSVYATMRVMDTQASPATTADQITISDMNGGRELYGKPPAAPMIPSAVTQFNSTYYKFDIDLRYNNGNQWLTGTNSYVLKLANFADSNEGVYSLSAQIFIKASTGKSDFFLGEDGIAVGHANFDTKAYLTYIENNNFFTTRTMFSYTNTPSDKTTYATTAMELVDLTGDGAKDMLIGQDTSNALMYFKNSMNTLGGFQDGSYVVRPVADAGNEIKWITSGDINGDGANDFAYVSTANNVVIYNNTYGMTPWIYHAYGGTVVKKIMLVDMNGDGKADLITLAGGHIYVQDLSRVSPSNPYPVIARIPDPDTTSSGITDFDIADMNGDGRPDIATVGTGGDASVNGVWQNNYTSNANPTVKKLNEAASGFSPRMVSGRVVSGTVVSTKARDQAPLTVTENTTGAPTGQVDLRMQFNTLSSDSDQILSVVARLGATDTENFYAWYSVDANGNTGMYTPIFAITNKATGNPDGGYVNYTFRLPPMAAGKAIFLRFTDSSTSLGTVTDTLDIDYAAVFSNTYGKYYSQTTVSYRYQVVSNSPTVYTCVRIGNIMNNADKCPDVVVAMNGAWKAYHFKVAIAGWAVTDASIYVTSTNALMANSAPTLFDVTDVNGDGLADVVVCRLTTVQNTISSLAYYMNLYPTNIMYTVTELGQTGGDGSITIAQVTNLQV